MKLSVMTPEDIIKWYNPKTEIEELLCDALKNSIKDMFSQDVLDEIEHELMMTKSDLSVEEYKVSSLEYELDEAHNKIKELEEEKDELENTIELMKSGLKEA